MRKFGPNIEDYAIRDGSDFGRNWKISPELMRAIDEIDNNIMRARQKAPFVFIGPQPPTKE